MDKWTLFYCSSGIVNEPPDEYLERLTIDSPKEAATISSHFETMCRLDFNEWPPKCKENFDKNRYQHTASSHRIYFGLYGRKIVIFFICRKVGMKALRIDLNRAKINQEAYEKWAEEGSL